MAKWTLGAMLLFCAGQTGHEHSATAEEVESPKVTTSDAAEPSPQAPYVRKTKAELKKTLTPIQFKVTQLEGTEPAFRNLYWNNKEPGLYRCVVCGLSLFSSETKFDSGTGWPSFFAPLSAEVVGTKRDWKMLYPRMEVHCKRCSAHLGHVFSDGPAPTGLRYCMNSASLHFERQDESSGEGDGSKLDEK